MICCDDVVFKHNLASYELNRALSVILLLCGIPNNNNNIHI